MVTIFIEGLECYAYHGVSEAERTVGHRYLLDLEYDVEARAVDSDRIEDTVDYASVMAALVRLTTESRFSTLERLAGYLVDELFREFPAMAAARLRVAKLAPPAPFIVESVGVELTHTR